MTRTATRPTASPPTPGALSSLRMAVRRVRAVRGRYALAVGGTVGLAALLRLPHLGDNPGWDGDEGYNLNIATNLAAGRHEMFALDYAFVQHPPLFFLLAAALFHLIPAGMTALRLLSVAFALGTMPLIAAVASQLSGEDRPDQGRRAGLLAALVYAVAPLVVVQNRFGYTYNGLAFWTMLALYALLRQRRDGGAVALLGAALATTAALSTDQEGAYLLPVLFFFLRGSLPARLGAVGVALSGPALSIAVMAWSDRAALLFDITHTAGRVTGGSIGAQVVSWLAALVHLTAFDTVILPGLVGLALLPARGGRRVVVFLLAAMLGVILKVRDPNPLFRAAEPLLPLICLGLGAVLAQAWAAVEAARDRRVRPLAVALCSAALLVAVVVDGAGALTTLPTAIPGLLPRSTVAATRMATRVNSCLRPDDLVLAMPQISWLFHARTAEVLQAVAVTGQASAFYPAGEPSSRWVYHPFLAAARYLVVDDFTRAWIARQAPERALVQKAQATWRRVYEGGEYTVYENPAHAPRHESGCARL